MRNILVVTLLVAMIVTGCGTSDNKTIVNKSNTPTVTEVLQSEVASYEDQQEALQLTDPLFEETQALAEESQVDDIEDVVNELEDQSETSLTDGSDTIELVDLYQSAPEVEYDDFIDLTLLDKDMVYAMVYQMMINPDDFRDKTIRMQGSFTSYYYEPNDKYYFAVLIEDALACCSSGIEFVWGDGSHIFPDEYPEEGQQVIVTGVYQTYKEGLDESTYVRLKDASMEVVE